MDEKEINKVEPQEAAIIAIIAVMMIGEKVMLFGKSVNKFDMLEEQLKKEKNYNSGLTNEQYFNLKHWHEIPMLWSPKMKQVLRLMRGSYDNWKSLVFRKEQKFEDLKKIRIMCEKIARESTHEFTRLKTAISKFLAKDYVDLNESIAYNVTIVSLLKFAKDLCENGQKNNNFTGKLADIIQKQNQINDALTSISPNNLFHNALKLYPMLNLPKDIDVNDSEDVQDANKKLGQGLLRKYIDNFTEPQC